MIAWLSAVIVVIVALVLRFDPEARRASDDRAKNR
jgi:hypothetical protein